MANQWLRLWHDMPNDPKWRTIARASKQRISDVICVYLHVLVDASANADERGRTQSINCEDIASALDLDTEQVETILLAMQGRVLDGERVSGWDKRQPAREDGSAERAKAWREAKKASSNKGERDRTQANAEKRPEEEKDKDTDKDKEEPKEEIAGDQASSTGQTPNLSSPANRSIEIAVYLRQRGIVGSNAANPNISAWGDNAKVTNELLDAALSVVAARKMNPMPGPNYLAPIIEDLLKPRDVTPPRAGAMNHRDASRAAAAASIGLGAPTYDNESTVIDADFRRIA